MNRHVGASFTLSVLVVVFFAVALYPPENARHPARPAAPSRRRSSTPPPPTPGVPVAEAIPDPVPEGARPGRGPVALASEPEASPRPAHLRTDPGLADAAPPLHRPSPAAEPAPASLVEASPRPAASGSPARYQVASRRRSLASARRPAFTRVGRGESLADVAARVYGTADAAGTLWLANRDVIDRSDAPLEVGMLLRTP